jgi:hypothetical protein
MSAGEPRACCNIGDVVMRIGRGSMKGFDARREAQMSDQEFNSLSWDAQMREARGRIARELEEMRNRNIAPNVREGVNMAEAIVALSNGDPRSALASMDIGLSEIVQPTMDELLDSEFSLTELLNQFEIRNLK